MLTWVEEVVDDILEGFFSAANMPVLQLAESIDL